MSGQTPSFTRNLMCVGLGCAMAATSAYAQDAAPRRSASALLEEVVVTARKREEGSQDVPLSISAFSGDQLEALKFRNLGNIGVTMPNVVLDDIGTSRGYANFSIRGLGINSSIPSIDPAVGLVVDGVYLGTNAGVMFDTFDLESIEVLRGPQGTLFGRNVTGGAVLLNTKKPTQDFEVSARASYETPEGRGGASSILSGSVSGGLSDTFAAKLAVYYNDDDGALVNQFDGRNHGRYEQTLIRPAFTWYPSDDMELVVRYEYQEVEADGPSAQTHTNGSGVPGAFANFDRDSFDFSIDEPGDFTLEVDFLNVQFSADDVFGGTISNIFGYRESTSTTVGDIDAQPVWIFHSDTASTYEQWSNELRWNGLLLDDRLNLTTGIYVFESELNYDEDRNLLGQVLVGTPLAGNPALTQNGGGELDVQSLGIFASGDYNITDSLILTAGIRWSQEDKEARVATLTANVNNECFIPGTAPNVSYVDREQACVPDFIDDESWSFVSPKLGLLYDLNASSRIYANWSRGFRSGGYNLRNTEFPIVFGPGPFDIEQADSIEIGYKTEWDGGQFNLAVFRTEGTDMQREVNLPSETAGVLQLIQNTADLEIFGFEADGTFALTDSFTLKATMGWMSNNYTDVVFDLNGDGAVNSADEALKLPRAPNLTYSLTAIHDQDFGDAGYLTSRLTYAYRDSQFFTDNNLGFIDAQDMMDAAFDFHTADGHWVFSLYGRNLLNSVLHGGDTQLPAALGGFPTGGTLSPLNRPRTFGIEASYKL